MAKLLNHPLDFCGVCLRCGHHGEQRYNGATTVLLPDSDDAVGEARLYTCHDREGCGSTYCRDFEPRPGLSADEDLCKMIDRREWAALRVARMRGAA